MRKGVAKKGTGRFMNEGGRSRRQSKKVAGDKDGSATETRTQRVAPGDCARRRIPHQLASRPGKAEQSLVNRTGENDVDCGLYGARMALADCATGGQARPGAGHTCPNRCIHSISLPSCSPLAAGWGARRRHCDSILCSAAQCSTAAAVVVPLGVWRPRNRL